jgi:membrane protease YdiL (CAAX protease family)
MATDPGMAAGVPGSVPANVAIPAPERPPLTPVGSALHTVLLIVLLVTSSALTAQTQHVFADHNGRIPIYAVTMVFEWLMLGYVVFGLRRHGVSLWQVVGGRWTSPEDVLLDVAIAAGYWLVAVIVLAGLAYALGFAGKENVDTAKKTLAFLVPRSKLEIGLWFALCATAGFCEEVIFRGYLQRQFAAFTRNAYFGIALSGIVFGVSHGYEGPRRMVLIAVYGMMFGLLAQWRKSLRPGMMAHAWHDAFSGMVLRLMK